MLHERSGFRARIDYHVDASKSSSQKGNQGCKSCTHDNFAKRDLLAIKVAANRFSLCVNDWSVEERLPSNADSEHVR